VDFDVHDLDEVNDRQRQIVVSLTVTLTWTDERLALTQDGYEVVDYLHLSADVLDLLWRPVLYLHQWAGGRGGAARSAHDEATRLVVDWRRGLVQWTSEYALRTKCHMEFSRFPLDRHACHVKLGTMGQQRDVSFRTGPVMSEPGLERERTRFAVAIRGLDEADDCNSTVSGFTVLLRRKTYPFLLNTYAPTAALVLMSAISFLIPTHLVPGRISLLFTTFLMLVNIANSSDNLNPKSEVPTAMDTWLRACMVFVAFALSEYAFLLHRRFNFGIGRQREAKDDEKAAKRCWQDK